MRVKVAEQLPYWKSSQSGPDKWLEKAATEIKRAGGEVLAEAFGSSEGRACFLLRFRVGDDTYRIEWPVLHSRTNNPRAAKVQAATMLYHDVKSSCVKARALGARVAFFAHLEIGDRVAYQLSSGEVESAFPKLLGAGPLEVVDAEVVE